MPPPATRPLTVDLGPRRSYPIYFEPLAEVPALLRAAGFTPRRALLVTDAHVAAHYAAPVTEALKDAGWTLRRVTLPPGETTKAYPHLHAIYDAALPWGIDRQTPVLALGGGVVGDLAGFAAATLLRGLPLVQLPTSLIAQVDSALGGKTGINHASGKNLIGAFHQPALVCADPATLATLPAREWTSGLAEVVKHALIADAGLFEALRTRWTEVLGRTPDVCTTLIPRAAAIKVGIVAEDEREAGRRALLNFGHTFGHAIERVAGYGTFTHGEAVALGMRAALHLSGRLHPDFDADEADRLVRQIPVPEGLADLATADLMDAMRQDKKVQDGRLRLILLRRIGTAYVTADVDPADVEAAWAFAKSM